MVTTGVQLKVSGESRHGADCSMGKKNKRRAREEAFAGELSETPQDGSDQEICGERPPFKKMLLAKGKVVLFGIFSTRVG